MVVCCVCWVELGLRGTSHVPVCDRRPKSSGQSFEGRRERPLAVGPLDLHLRGHRDFATLVISHEQKMRHGSPRGLQNIRHVAFQKTHSPHDVQGFVVLVLL